MPPRTKKRRTAASATAIPEVLESSDPQSQSVLTTLKSSGPTPDASSPSASYSEQPLGVSAAPQLPVPVPSIHMISTHISNAIKQRIISGQFTDLGTLVPPKMGADERKFVMNIWGKSFPKMLT